MFLVVDAPDDDPNFTRMIPMAVDHRRPLPVATERLEFLAEKFYNKPLRLVDAKEGAQLMQIALLGEQVEAVNDVRFFISEAYDIYNARFR